MSPRVAVIGGGAAGLAAALQLRTLGIEPTLLEAAATVGGVIRTVRRNGWLAESGPNTAAEPEPAVRALLDGAGLSGRTLRADRANGRRYLVHQAKLVAVPKSVGELLAWPVLSATGRMRLLKEPFIKAAPGDLEESVDAFVRRRLGDEMADRVFDPLVGGASGGDPTQLLMRYAFPRLVEWEQLGGSLLKGSMRAGMEARRRAGRGAVVSGGPWSCPDGLAEVPTRVATFLGASVRTGIQVCAIVPNGGGYDVMDQDGARERFDGVVCSVPSAAFSGLRVGVAGGDVFYEIAASPRVSLATVSLGFRRESVAHSLDGHGVLAPFCERREILGALFASSLFPGRAPEGHVLVTAFVGGSRRPELAELSEGELIDVVCREFGELLGVRGDVCFESVAKWPDSQPQSVAGHTARLGAVAALEQDTPGLVFAGAWRDGMALSEAMRGGCAAANKLVQSLRAPSPSSVRVSPTRVQS